MNLHRYKPIRAPQYRSPVKDRWVNLSRGQRGQRSSSQAKGGCRVALGGHPRDVSKVASWHKLLATMFLAEKLETFLHAQHCGTSSENNAAPTQDWASLVAQVVKNPPVMRETWVQSLGWEDPLKKGTATHASILAWRIPWTVQSMGSRRVRQD